ncbi:MAG TPA: Fis family transcriptional regulator [Cytophagales bacterium]|nr:Fis family transcriptional regulator [Cytophagales bacterium]HAP60542.1 Fis family transcriptional regulator [Cytophagales bacterium]
MPDSNVYNPVIAFYALKKACDAIYWINEQAEFVFVNDMSCHLAGYSESELLTMRIFDITSRYPEDNWTKFWAEAQAGGTVEFEATHQKRDGRVFPVAVRANYIQFGDQGYICAFVRDVSEQKRLETELREAHHRLKLETKEELDLSEDRFHKIFKNSNDAIYILDPEADRIVDANPRASKDLGYTQEELRNLKISDVHPYEMPQLTAFTQEVIKSGSGWTDELTCYTKQHTFLPAEISASPIKLKGKRLVVAMVRNIAERKRMEMEIRRANQSLEKQVKDRTHELEKTNRDLQNALSELEELKEQLEERNEELQVQNDYLVEEIKINHNFEEIISQSKSLDEVLRRIEQVANTGATVLIHGESGTGKELIARAIHRISDRAGKPLVKVNCAALPANLIESELFGHEKGAFTGANNRKPGRFEMATGGTLFLDEIGELPIDLQPKLLRALQEGEFERVGGTQSIQVDVRILAATNRDLEVMISEGEFREDLFYRLNVFPIYNPPLRERKEDIPILCRHFIEKYAKKNGKPVNRIPVRVLNQLLSYSWPGNVRELENIIERAVIISAGEELEIGDWLKSGRPRTNKLEIGSTSLTLEDLEREHIQRVLKATGWKVSGINGAAEMLGLKATTLESRMKKLNILRPK